MYRPQQGSITLGEHDLLARTPAEIAQRGYVMETGRIVKEGAAADLLADQDIQEFYLGVGDAGRRSFRDVKSYRRRKKWTS